jgi:hypothetical protein
MKTLHGTVTAISHIFYLSGQSKSFFIEIQTRDKTEPSFVLVRIGSVDPTFRDVQIHPKSFIDCGVVITGLKGSSLMLNDHDVKIHMLTKDSTIEKTLVLKKEDEYLVAATEEVLVSYEGIVTRDQFMAAGIVVLDNKVTVVISTICVVTNVRMFKQGQRVGIHLAHLRRFQDGKQVVLIVCAKGRVDLLDDNSNSMHSRGDYKCFERNGLIKHCLYLKISAKQLLWLYQMVQTFQTHFEGILMPNPRQVENVLLGEEFPQDVLNFFGGRIETIPHRSLLNEFLITPHNCSVNIHDGSEDWPSNLTNLSQVCSRLEAEFNAQNEMNVGKPSGAGRCSFKYLAIDSAVDLKDLKVIGFFKIDRVSGQSELHDKTGKLAIVFSKSPPKPNAVIKLTRFVACKEMSSVGRHVWNDTYLIVTDFTALKLNTDNQVIITTEVQPSDKWIVKLHSHPMMIGTNTEMSVVLAAKRLHGNQGSFLRISAGLGTSYPFGATLVVKDYLMEKFSSTLNNFLKSGLLQNYTPTVLDVVDLNVVNPTHTTKDTFDISEFDAVPEGELVNIEAVIVEKWLELSKHPTGQSNQDPLLSHVDLEIKLTSSTNEMTRKHCPVISLYVTKWDKKARPLGLLRGVKIRFDSIIKTISRKSNPYLVTTLFTTTHIINPDKVTSPHIDTNVEIVYNQPLEWLSRIVSHSAFHCMLTLESVFKLSITAECGACGHMVKKGVCSFVGCHASASVMPNFVTKARFKVEDPTTTAVLICDSSAAVRTIMKHTQEEWQTLEAEAQDLGELLYLGANKKSIVIRPDMTRTEKVFAIHCRWMPEKVISQFHCICRLFKNTNNGTVQEGLNLYCIGVSDKLRRL